MIILIIIQKYSDNNDNSLSFKFAIIKEDNNINWLLNEHNEEDNKKKCIHKK